MVPGDIPEKRARKEARKEQQDKAEVEYKQIVKSIMQLQRNEDPAEVQAQITQYLKRAEELYPVVHKKLTGSAQDARFIKTSALISVTTAKRINSSARPFNLARIIRSMKRAHGDQLMSHVMNEFVVDCFKIAPTFEYFYGAIRQEGLEVKLRRRRNRIITEQERDVSSVKATERDIKTECEQDSTPKEVEMIFRRIRDQSANAPRAKVRFIETIVDPRSFTQTVENIFHTTFLVKEGRVGVKRDTDNSALLTLENASDKNNRDLPSSQSIFSFSKDDYNRWIS